ncbi:hypothetical protein V7068_22225 [Bacillus sp. JJ634]
MLVRKTSSSICLTIAPLVEYNFQIFLKVSFKILVISANPQYETFLLFSFFSKTKQFEYASGLNIYRLFWQRRCHVPLLRLRKFKQKLRAFQLRKGSLLTVTSFNYLSLQVVNSTPHVVSAEGGANIKNGCSGVACIILQHFKNSISYSN